MAAALTDEKIDSLDNLLEAWDLMDDLDISTEDVEDLERAKTILHVHASKSKGNTAALPNQDVLTNIAKRDEERREKLVTLYHRVEKFLNELPEIISANLKTAIPDLDQQMSAVLRNMKDGVCPILIAGETSAGKSTLLNLMLGQTHGNLLPVAHLSTTSVICELKYSERPHAIAHPWPGDTNGGQVEIDLSGENADGILSPFVHQKGDRDGKFAYQKVEIFWPSELLKAGVTIVDSPGIGESEEMTRIVKEYEAFGFIFVMNSTNAGGIQEDRIQDLIFNLMKPGEQKKGEEVWKLDPKSAIFVANKWELVPKKEHEEVKEAIYSQLSDIWASLSTSQVFFLSTKKAMESLKEGVVNEEYGKLLRGIETLFPVGLDQRIGKHFHFLSMAMQRATLTLKTILTKVAMEGSDRKTLCAEILARLLLIGLRPGLIIQEMEEEMKKQIKEGIAKVKAHLEDADVARKLCRWEETQCPDGKGMDEVVDLMKAVAMKRISHEINRCDKEKKIFESIQNHLLGKFNEKFSHLEDELVKIEQKMGQKVVSAVDSARTRRNTDEQDLSTGQKIFLALTAPVWIPLGFVAGLVVGVIALPFAVYRWIKERRKLKDYRKDKPKVMAKVTETLLKEILDNNRWESILSKQLEATMALLKDRLSCIPGLIEADKALMQKLMQSIEKDQEMLQTLGPWLKDALALQGALDLMYLRDIKSYEIGVHDLVDWQISDRPVAQGNFSKVFRAKLSRQGTTGLTRCAVKIFKNSDTQELCSLSESNASDARLEESNLGQLDHPHIVKYFGSALMTDGSDRYLLMVMEFCACSLESYIANRDYYLIPGECRGSNETKWQWSIVHATELARQIADGIAGIHGRGFVHRDLKAANILMSSDHQIRLADLGLSKSEEKITGTVAGTLLYMAPEMLAGQSYDHSIDLFAYGLILWEMWYGENVSKVYNLRNIDQLATVAFTAAREPEAGGVWRRTMLECWSVNMANRPTAETCRDRFAAYKTQLESAAGGHSGC